MSTTLSHTSPHAAGTEPETGSVPPGQAAPKAASPRVPMDRSGPLESVLDWACRRIYGRVLDPLRAAYHHRGVLASSLGVELSVLGWRKLSKTHRALAVMVAAQEIGCSWCLDFGYWENVHQGVDSRLLREVARWRTSPEFTDLDRAVMEYAAAATATPPMVTDAMVERLRRDLTDGQVVELAAWVALENQRSRLNSGLGLTSQGFRADCAVPSIPAS